MHSPLSSKGFSLIELLIVVFIIALFATPVILSIDRVNERKLGNQIFKLKLWLERVMEEVAITGTVYGVKQQQDNQLISLVYADETWFQVSNIPPFNIDDSIKIIAEINGDVQRNFTDLTDIEDSDLKLTGEKETPLFPDFFFNFNGQVNPEVVLKLKQGDLEMTISWDATGEIIQSNEVSKH